MCIVKIAGREKAATLTMVLEKTAHISFVSKWWFAAMQKAN